MNIPPLLSDLIKSNEQLYSCLMITINNLGPWFETSKMVFFPEYTDHGIGHVEMVIRTANNLIDDNCRKYFTAEDATTLVTSCLLHDAAMHLTEDGFIELIKPESRFNPIKGFKDLEWSILWENFLAEASRYDQRKLKNLFGDTDPVHRPNNNPQNWTKKERILIGEFIRKNHGRLAHEIAVYGVPGLSALTLELDEGLNEFKNLSGLVARSHSLPIRSCLHYLESNFDLRDYKECHAVFLMVLLRVSDYLQIDSERAPKEYLKIQKLRSPLSQKEWDAHHAIKNIHHNHEDPEAIYIKAGPENSEIFTKVREWLLGIQAELDSSWAVLGEIYGRFPFLKHLGIAIRRVRSNIDDIDTFSDSINYVPVCAQFSTASADLLKLLIGPLYGNKPEIGVRELLQNSLDAVIERKEIVKNRSDIFSKPLDTYNSDIIISVFKDDDGACWFSLRDCGVGMTVDTVINYFLKAGASFRKSDLWRANFEDSRHKSKIHRSGRFGVGALAAFLLGDEIRVTTRNIFAPADKGIFFKATIDSEIINITYTTADIGTSIVIQINENTYDDFSKVEPNWNRSKSGWDWYCLDTVKVTRDTDKKDGYTKQHYLIPDCNENLPEGWYRINDTFLSDVQWTYNKKTPSLTCNGIIISEGDTRIIWTDKRYYARWMSKERIESNSYGNNVSITMPNISVFDPDGNFPLNLQRSGLTTNVYPFQDSLLDDIIKDMISYLLVNLPEKFITDGVVDDFYFKMHYPGLKIHGAWSTCFITKNGFSFVDEWHISKLNIKRAIMLPVFNKDHVHPKISENTFKDSDAVFLFNVDDGNPAISSFLRFIMGSSLDYNVKGLEKLHVYGRRILLPKEQYDYFKNWRKTPKFLKNSIRHEWSNDNYVLLQIGTCQEEGFDFRNLVENVINNDVSAIPVIISEWYLKDKADEIQMTPISILWEDLIGTVEIPFKKEDRKVLLPNAYASLDRYIRSHEANSQKRKK